MDKVKPPPAAAVRQLRAGLRPVLAGGGGGVPSKESTRKRMSKGWATSESRRVSPSIQSIKPLVQQDKRLFGSERGLMVMAV